MKTVKKNIFRSFLFLSALLGLPLLAASSQEDDREFGSGQSVDEAAVLASEGRRPAADQTKAADAAVSCDSTYCTGLTTDLFSQYHVSGTIRAVVKSDAVKDLMVAKGCEQTYSIYLPEAPDARDLMLKQFMIAETLNSRVKVRIIKSGTGVHCVFGSMWRYNQ